MNNAAIIVCSHGDFAKYAMDSAEMIIGAQSNYKAISVNIGSSLEDVVAEMEHAIKELDISNGLIMLVDIFGGTPSNVSSGICLSRDNVQLYSGLNLPILLELLLNRDKTLEELDTILEEAYHDGFKNISKMLKES